MAWAWISPTTAAATCASARPRSSTSGIEVVPGLPQADEMELVIRVPDVDATYRTLTAQGVRFDAPPADMPWGNRQAWTRDPSGTRVSIYTSRR
jgi:uncharacterized glyoxalase superfamily protein PhnB